jgi:hypothetical protein
MELSYAALLTISARIVESCYRRFTAPDNRGASCRARLRTVLRVRGIIYWCDWNGNIFSRIVGSPTKPIKSNRPMSPSALRIQVQHSRTPQRRHPNDETSASLCALADPPRKQQKALCVPSSRFVSTKPERYLTQQGQPRTLLYLIVSLLRRTTVIPVWDIIPRNRTIEATQTVRTTKQRWLTPASGLQDSGSKPSG